MYFYMKIDEFCPKFVHFEAIYVKIGTIYLIITAFQNIQLSVIWKVTVSSFSVQQKLFALMVPFNVKAISSVYCNNVNNQKNSRYI